jgi:hypothetical protein
MGRPQLHKPIATRIGSHSQLIDIIFIQPYHFSILVGTQAIEKYFHSGAAACPVR